MRRDALPDALALGALTLPMAAYFAWLLPVVGDTASVSPDERERLRGFEQYAGQLEGTPDHFSVVPELFGRSGAVAVAALLLLPFAALAARRRWAAYAVGGALAVFVITPRRRGSSRRSPTPSPCRSLVAWRGSSPSGSRSPAGSACSPGLIGPLVAPVALALGVVLQLLYPGDFGYFLDDGGPAWATWFAVVGCVVALFVGFRGRPPLERRAALASCLLLLPTYVHGLTNWSPSPSRPPEILSEGLIAAVREHVPAGAVVYADPRASYRLGAYAPVRVCVNPISHVADTVENRPRERAREFLRFARAGDVVTPARRCGATWLVVDRERWPDLAPRLPVSTATRGGRSTAFDPRVGGGSRTREKRSRREALGRVDERRPVQDAVADHVQPRCLPGSRSLSPSISTVNGTGLPSAACTNGSGIMRRKKKW